MIRPNMASMRASMVANVSAVVPGSTFAWSSTPSNVSPETPVTPTTARAASRRSSEVVTARILDGAAAAGPPNDDKSTAAG
jgi:hypothetical protein